MQKTAKVLLENLKIARLYHQLPFIIYKKHYLIPQKPRHLPTAIHTMANLNKQLKQQYPEKVSAQFRSQYLQKQKGNFERMARESSKKQESESYLQKMRIWKENYIIPLKKKGQYNQEYYYYRQNSAKIKDLIKQENPELLSFKGKIDLIRKYIIKHFASISQKERRQFEQRYKKMRKQSEEISEETKELYKIPHVSKRNSPALYYMMEQSAIRENQHRHDLMNQFQLLPQSLRMKYTKKVKEQSEYSKLEFQTFLKRYNLTLVEFQSIKSICAEYQTMKKIRKQKRFIKSLLEEQKKEQSNPKSVEEIDEINFLLQKLNEEDQQEDGVDDSDLIVQDLSNQKLVQFLNIKKIPTTEKNISKNTQKSEKMFRNNEIQTNHQTKLQVNLFQLDKKYQANQKKDSFITSNEKNIQKQKINQKMKIDLIQNNKEKKDNIQKYNQQDEKINENKFVDLKRSEKSKGFDLLINEFNQKQPLKRNKRQNLQPKKTITENKINIAQKSRKRQIFQPKTTISKITQKIISQSKIRQTADLKVIKTEIKQKIIKKSIKNEITNENKSDLSAMMVKTEGRQEMIKMGIVNEAVKIKEKNSTAKISLRREQDLKYGNVRVEINKQKPLTIPPKQAKSFTEVINEVQKQIDLQDQNDQEDDAAALGDQVLIYEKKLKFQAESKSKNKSKSK